MSTERFEKAVTKLYKAFHNNELNGMCCKRCAVGNMCDNTGGWGSTYDTKKCIETGYSPYELMNIEHLFMFGHRYDDYPWDKKWDVGEYQDKEVNFKGLCAVVEYLCELDNIPNVMDYSSLFEYNEKGAKKELQTVFP